MNDTERILTAHEINNPTDAALVRLAGVAVAMPTEPVETLVQRVSFAHPGDAKLAHAIVDAIRSNTPPVKAGGGRKSMAVAVTLGAAALGTAAWALSLNQSLVAERALRQDQSAAFAKKIGEIQAETTSRVGELQAATTAALATVDNSTKENVQLFAASASAHLSRIETLSAENQALKGQVARLEAEVEKLNADIAKEPMSP